MGSPALAACSIVVFLVAMAAIFFGSADVKITTLHLMATMFWCAAAIVKALGK
jgi:hypothetical protein